MREFLKQLNIDLDNDKEKTLKSFFELFLEYNSKVNLISKNDEKYLFQKHIYDSLAINLFIEKYIKKGSIKIMDIGTGGGFPSFPVSILYPDFNISAVDSIGKKINFINNTAKTLNLKNLTAYKSRVEDLPVSFKNSFDTVTSRAVAELRVILEYALPFVKTGGYFVAYKAQKADEEIKNSQNALKILNSKIIDKIEYFLPLQEENKRVLIIIKKQKTTDKIYPRQNGKVKNNPL